jgi:hypothetical protein
MKEALLNRRPDENFFRMKEALGLGSIFVFYLLYKAYQFGEQQGKFGHGLLYILRFVVMLGGNRWHDFYPRQVSALRDRLLRCNL